MVSVFRRLIAGFGVALLGAAAVLGSAAGARATEYDMRIYVLPESALAAAIGSGDAALHQAMLADTAYIADMGLEERFTDDGWRKAADQLIAGLDDRDAFANGFAVELLLRQITPPDGRFEVLLPFTDLEDVAQLMKVAGQPDSAALLRHITYGIWTDQTGLAARIGPSEYPARIWLVPAGDAAARTTLPPIRQVATVIEATETAPGSATAAQGKKLLEAAIRAYLAEPWQDPMTPAETEQRFARHMADPYIFTQPSAALVEQLDPIGAALDRAAETGNAAVFVYRSW